MNRNTVSFTRTYDSHGEFYGEHVIVSVPPFRTPSAFLDLVCFGSSLFRAGGILPIRSDSWVLQLQTEGTAQVRTGDGSFRVEPSDLLLVPPDTLHTYHVPEQGDMRKYFLIFRQGPLPELLLGEEIRNRGIFIRNSDPSFRDLCDEIRNDFSGSGPDSAARLSARLYALLFRLRELILRQSPSGRFETNLRNAVQNLPARSTLDSLSESFGVGKYSLIREFRRETGATPVRFMRNLRLNRAREMLSLSGLSIAEVAERCGFSSASFFSYEFRKQFGMTPREARKRNSPFSPAPSEM